MKYLLQYIREQRVEREIEADSENEALKIFNRLLETFDLSSPNDQSDDPGEIIFLERLPSELQSKIVQQIRQRKGLSENA